MTPLTVRFPLSELYRFYYRADPRFIIPPTPTLNRCHLHILRRNITYSRAADVHKILMTPR